MQELNPLPSRSSVVHYVFKKVLLVMYASHATYKGRNLLHVHVYTVEPRLSDYLFEIQSYEINWSLCIVSLVRTFGLHGG